MSPDHFTYKSFESNVWNHHVIFHNLIISSQVRTKFQVEDSDETLIENRIYQEIRFIGRWSWMWIGRQREILMETWVKIEQSKYNQILLEDVINTIDYESHSNQFIKHSFEWHFITSILRNDIFWVIQTKLRLNWIKNCCPMIPNQSTKLNDLNENCDRWWKVYSWLFTSVLSNRIWWKWEQCWL
jgi:hypothetical protein